MIRKSLSLTLALLAVASAPAFAEAGGVFIAVGGGTERPEIVQTILNQTGGTNRRVIVMPIASGDPSSTGLAYKQFFVNAGVHDVASLPLANRDAANDLEPVKDIGRADLLYFTGGDQNRLVKVLANTAAHGSIQTAWQRQAVIAGTSAGAMVWGPEFIANGSSQGALLYGFSRDSQGVPGLELRPGLNLWDNLIVDTHFTEQQRLGRLLLAIASTPGATGLGVDEGTAAVVTNDTIQVIGAGTVTVLETDKVTINNAQSVGPGSPLGLGKVALHRLLPGMTYLRKWKMIQEDRPLAQAPTEPPVPPLLVLAGTDAPRKGLTPMADFIRASGGSQARILLLTGAMASQNANQWRTYLLKFGAAQVVNYQSVELSDQGLGIAIQHATGILMLEDDQASLLRALNANQTRLGNLVISASKRMPFAAAGNAVRIVGARALFGTPGQADYQSLPGLKLLPSAVIEKDFWKPETMDRMVRAQLQASRSLAIGLSPDNAITISGGQATVAGQNQVMFLDANEATALQLAADTSEKLSAAGGLTLSVVPPTGSYDFLRHEPRF